MPVAQGKWRFKAKLVCRNKNKKHELKKKKEVHRWGWSISLRLSLYCHIDVLLEGCINLDAVNPEMPFPDRKLQICLVFTSLIYSSLRSYLTFLSLHQCKKKTLPWTSSMNWADSRVLCVNTKMSTHHFNYSLTELNIFTYYLPMCFFFQGFCAHFLLLWNFSHCFVKTVYIWKTIPCHTL